MAIKYELKGRSLFLNLDGKIVEFTQAQAAKADSRTNQPSKSQHPKELVGNWRCEVQADGGTIVMNVRLGANGSYYLRGVVRDYGGNNLGEDIDKGTWVADGSKMVIVTEDETLHVPYWFKNGYLMVKVDGNQLAYKRVR